MDHRNPRRVPAVFAACVLAASVLTGCFSGDSGDDGMAQDCSTVKSALEEARDAMTEAQGEILSSPESARSELKQIADNLKAAADGIENAELKNALVAAAGDLEKAFGGGGGMPPANLGGGLAKLDQTVQSKCSTG